MLTRLGRIHLQSEISFSTMEKKIISTVNPSRLGDIHAFTENDIATIWNSKRIL